MSGESLPSGVLKVAEEAKEHLNAAIDAARHGIAAITRREQTRLCEERIDQLAALASPPPQATGALSQDARDAARYRTLRHSLSGEAGCSHTQMPVIHDPRNSMLTYLPHGLDQELDAIIAERNDHD